MAGAQGVRADVHGDGSVVGAEHAHAGGHGGSGALALGALGVVFGDIGTSPIYAVREAFEQQDLPVVRTNALGLASLSLVVIISVKYLTFVMKASQALISGAFSLTVQAVQLDYLPRLRVLQTSGKHQGQVYVPLVNWALLAGCIGLVLGFRSSGNLAAAYGIAVTTTMAITSLLFGAVLQRRWGWSRLRALALVVPFLVVDLAFLAGNIPKIPQGGWFPVFVGVVLLVQMATWRRGRELVAARIKRGEQPLSEVLKRLDRVERVQGTAVFLFKDAGMAPPAFVNNMRHNHVVHATTLIVAVETADVPRIPPGERCEAERVVPGVHQVLLRYGFMEEPDVPGALAFAAADGNGFRFDPDDVTYFIGSEDVRSGKAPGMHPLVEI